MSPGQASYVIDQLLKERRISPGEINRYLGDMHREISDLEQQLASLRTAAGSAAGGAWRAGAATGVRRGRPAASGRKRGRPAKAKAAAATAGATKKRRRRRSAITPEQLASQQLQGRYLGLIRQIPANKRAQYTKIAKERGREAAVREMAQTLGK